MMENLAQRVKTSVQLADVLALYHLQPDRAGFLHCPFHNGDRSPSLKVYPDQNTWYCFGCGKSLGLSDSKESYRNYRERLSEQRKKAKEQSVFKLELQSRIAQRRALWLKIKSSEIASHEQAQEAAELAAQIEHLDYEIQQMGGEIGWKKET